MGDAQAVVRGARPPLPLVATAPYTTNTAMASEFEVLLWPAEAIMWLW